MSALLQAADMVVHNAGGLPSVEALATGMPVVILIASLARRQSAAAVRMGGAGLR